MHFCLNLTKLKNSVWQEFSLHFRNRRSKVRCIWPQKDIISELSQFNISNLCSGRPVWTHHPQNGKSVLGAQTRLVAIIQQSKYWQAWVNKSEPNNAMGFTRELYHRNLFSRVRLTNSLFRSEPYYFCRHIRCKQKKIRRRRLSNLFFIIFCQNG